MAYLDLERTEAMSAAPLIQATGDLSDVTGVIGSGAASRDPARDPSMEEILASIRRIIAQDQSLFAAEPATGGAVEQAPAPGAADPAETPVHGLGQQIEAQTGHREAAGADGEAAGQSAAEVNPGGGGGEALVSFATEASVGSAFQTLVASRFARDPATIQAMTREALQPLIASWLDAHLPALVENLVRAEIERITRDA
jgi:uncharacterized protein